MSKDLPTPTIATTISRRSLLLWGVTAVFTACNKSTNRNTRDSLTLNPVTRATPPQTEGPFYPNEAQQDKDNDLTRIKSKSRQARGKAIIVQGRITDTDGTPLANTLVEIWQANAWGRYRHERDPNAAPLDPDFQGWGQTTTDSQGHYRFKTIQPGAYPAGPGWTRPPHIHFKVSCPGYYTLTTQMYFPDQPLNGEDLILQNVPPAQHSMVIAKPVANNDNSAPEFQFDIVLLKISQ